VNVDDNPDQPSDDEDLPTGRSDVGPEESSSEPGAIPEPDTTASADVADGPDNTKRPGVDLSSLGVDLSYIESFRETLNALTQPFAEIQRTWTDALKIEFPLSFFPTDWDKITALNAEFTKIQGRYAEWAKVVEDAEWTQKINIPALDYAKDITFPTFDTAWLKPLADQVSVSFAGLNTDALDRIQQYFRQEQELARRDAPDNWTGLDDSFDLIKLLMLAERGIPVAWVPSAEVLTDLTDTPEAEQFDVLLSHKANLLTSCDLALRSTLTGSLSEQAALLLKVVKALESGMNEPAQALAASVLDTVLRKSFLPPRLRYYGALIKKIEGFEERPFREIRWLATYWPVLQAFGEFYEHKGDPIPLAFNRHATSHAAGDIQYNEINALTAVLLATSVLCECHAQDVQGHQQSTDPDDPPA
jgi:hypothetical protein